jgi:hypothetical protein
VNIDDVLIPSVAALGTTVVTTTVVGAGEWLRQRSSQRRSQQLLDSAIRELEFLTSYSKLQELLRAQDVEADNRAALRSELDRLLAQVNSVDRRAAHAGPRVTWRRLAAIVLLVPSTGRWYVHAARAMYWLALAFFLLMTTTLPSSVQTAEQDPAYRVGLLVFMVTFYAFPALVLRTIAVALQARARESSPPLLQP